MDEAHFGMAVPAAGGAVEPDALVIIGLGKVVIGRQPRRALGLERRQLRQQHIGHLVEAVARHPAVFDAGEFGDQAADRERLRSGKRRVHHLVAGIEIIGQAVGGDPGFGQRLAPAHRDRAHGLGYANHEVHGRTATLAKCLGHVSLPYSAAAGVPAVAVSSASSRK